MKEIEKIYKPEGVCCKYIKLTISEDENNKENSLIKEVQFMGGCPGNALGLGLAIQNRSVKSVMELLKGVKCGSKPTSCPDQLSKALEDYLK